MKSLKYLLLTFAFLFTQHATTVHAAIATKISANNVAEYGQMKGKSTFSTLNQSKASPDNGQKEKVWAILGLIGFGVCLYFLLQSSGPLAILTYLLLGMLGIACLGAALIGFIIYRRKRNKNR
jgi:multidrug transporter EmrE-like cation transporter